MTTTESRPASAAERVKVEIDGPVAVVSMARPEKMNGLDFPMFAGLLGAARQLRDNRRVRAVILRGEGENFCTGLDFAGVGREPRKMLTWFLKLPLQQTNRFQEVVWAWRRLPLPVIAVVQGRCYGGGIQIALGADFRIAAPDAEFSVMEGKWGLIPDMTGSVTLAQLVGIDVAKRLTMTAELFDGEEAERLGLVTELADDPLARARELAEQLAARSPDAVTATKRLFERTWNRTPRAAFEVERRLQSALLRGANHKLARKAGMAREVPRFVDRKR